MALYRKTGNCNKIDDNVLFCLLFFV